MFSLNDKQSIEQASLSLLVQSTEYVQPQQQQAQQQQLKQYQLVDLLDNDFASLVSLKSTCDELQQPQQFIQTTTTIKTNNQHCPVCGLLNKELADFEIHVNGHFTD